MRLSLEGSGLEVASAYGEGVTPSGQDDHTSPGRRPRRVTRSSGCPLCVTCDPRLPAPYACVGYDARTPRRGRRHALASPVMGRSLDVDKLVGAAEIAKRLGVARPQVVYGWRTRHEDFPKPVLRLSIGQVWYWPEVQRWAEATGRL